MRDVELTPRQAAVLQALADGRNVKEIAVSLGVCPPTVWTHVRLARIRLGAKSLYQMMVIAASQEYVKVR